jgi:hypothetical protein
MINSTVKLPQIAQFASTNVNSANQGIMATAPAGTTTNVDLKLTDDCFLTGGILRTLNSTFGDYTAFQVVDVDNMLGYGAGTVLGQYTTCWYMRSDAQEQVNENTPYPAKVLAGLYLRVIYVSIGTTDVTITVMYRLHKALF